ncbi:MAG: DUF4845 domain-containing protein [Pseudomonadota bacterium]|nr:DUF4845 domain-containing protein [Pseudomonadota bacterium]MDP1903626.1 DUF4845 domain-containing protein [Pseudomonadota bacterium]MDP2353906.1 DUF4845 domain-containing protein [Pseudomonadota bacterium]
MKRQIGATLGGMIFFLLLLSLAAYTASRVIPAYMDYWLVQRALVKLVAQANPQGQDDEQLREQFTKQLSLNNITLAKRSDLYIERIPTGVRLTVTFSAKRPFLGPVHLCMDFQAEAQSGD